MRVLKINISSIRNKSGIFLILCCFNLFLLGCRDTPSIGKNAKQKTGGAIQNTSLQGTWIRHDKTGFTLIVIKDSTDILYYQFLDRMTKGDSTNIDRYWYYKSPGRLGYWDSDRIWIGTDKFRFDYKIFRDTLIEYDKMGDQGKFVRVYTEEEKVD